ncbi:hypothetical protein V5F40_21775 [Xanthobacter sp. DSM 14520]|uniref:hypothetical protein n=1 Tax=Xanthobacter autotrophicus (strain ATCC BAA-1158 / Py2) TaxID=78245 RepID=UPI003728FA61
MSQADPHAAEPARTPLAPGAGKGQIVITFNRSWLTSILPSVVAVGLAIYTFGPWEKGSEARSRGSYERQYPPYQPSYGAPAPGAYVPPAYGAAAGADPRFGAPPSYGGTGSYAGEQRFAPQPAFSAPQVRAPEIRGAAVEAPQPPSAVNALVATSDPNARLLSDAEVSGKVLELIAKLPSVQDFDGQAVPPAKAIQVFFDPRCPYCHKAYDALAGKLPVNWIPVAALGDVADGNARARAILQAPDRRAALKKSFGGDALPAAGPTADLDVQLGASFEAFAQITQMLKSSGSPQLGVPTFLVPRPDGQVMIYVGYDPDILAKLTRIYRG